MIHALGSRQRRVATYMLTASQRLVRLRWLGYTTLRHHNPRIQVHLPIVLVSRVCTPVVILFRCRAGCIEVFRAHDGAIKLASKDAESDMRLVMARQ